jgi:serine/threonine-protein kinase
MNESPSARTNQLSWVGRTLSSRYHILSRLGSGGMSTVYKAQDANLQRTVAIKIIHPHLSENPEFVKRFEQEAAAVAQLRHPNIMQVHDFNHDGEIYYIVFEYIPGQSLDQKLKALKEASILMPLHDVILTMLPLCDAVAYAHSRRMIHRDLKPSNVIINLLNQPILLDFGIAKIVGGDYVHTATGTTVGTAAYMSPEQVLGGEVDNRADIYSLGIMLYEMAAGQPPYEGDSAMTVMMKHVHEPLPDVRLYNSNLPASFMAIQEKALAKKPADRFDSATEMALALRQVEQQLTASRATTHPFIGIPARPTAAETLPPKPDPVTTPPPPIPETITPSTELLPISTASTPSPSSKKRSPWLLAGAALLILLILAAAVYFVRQNSSTTVVPTSQDMVSIPAGPYTVGAASNESNVSPEQQLNLGAYWLDRYEVTNADYAAFIAAGGAEPPVSWNGAAPPTGKENHPAQGLTWQMAADYCQAQGKRLPTEAEWEVAARGELGLLYAWGNSVGAISLPSSGTYPVGSIPANRSPFGVYDMSGNVWEWVDQPYTAVPSDQKIARGGAYNFLKELTYRLQGDPTVPTMFNTAGVRCAANEVEVVPDANLLVQDDFTDQTSGWPVVEEGSVLSGYHPPDYYHVQSGQPNQIATAFFGGTFTNITLESNVFVDSTDTETGDFRYGLIVRRNGPRYYAFTVSPRTNRWTVLKAQPDGLLQTLAEGELAPLSNTAESPDRLRVDASGETFLFFVDGQLITTVKDASYTEGDIGFYVETFDEERAHIHYDLVQAERIERMPDTTIILDDDFTDPGSGWPETEEGALLSGYHPPDFYHVQAGVPNFRSTAFFDGQLDDFTMETDLFVEATDTENGDFYYGIVVREADETEYALLISPRAGQWQVVKTDAAGSEVLGSGADDSLQGESASDRLRLDAQGELFIFHVNGRPVLAVEEIPPSPHSIGFIVQTLDESRAHIHYDVLTVREADADIAAVPTVISLTDDIVPELEATAVAEAEPTATPEPTVEPTLEEPTPKATTPVGPLPSSIGMVRVDAGDYSVGTDTVVTIPEFWIDRTEVSNAAYALFVTDTGQTPPSNWVDGTIPDGLAEHPVQGVTWETAAAYCTWVNKRLPTEAEWEIAARGPHGFLYPWGNEAQTVRLPNNNTYPVGTMVQNRSYFGAYDMIGNVWEWVADPFNLVAAGEQIIRGGAYNFLKNMSEFVAGNPENDLMFSNTGIRCAATAVNSEADATTLLSDDFSDTLSGWYNARAPIGPFFYGYHPTDFYHVQVSAPHNCLTVYRDLPVDNFAAEVQIFIAATDSQGGDFRYGLIARENGNEFYAFIVSPRIQTWKVLKSTPAGLTLMAEGSTTTLSGADQAHRDRLYVTGEGPALTFFVNGELVSQITDPDYVQGNMGFIVQTIDETYAHIHYDSIEVRPLAAPTPTPDMSNDATYPVDTPTCQGSVRIEDTLVQFTTHTVAEGENLSNIAALYNVTQADILAANGKGIDNPDVIRAGQTIIIPQG